MTTQEQMTVEARTLYAKWKNNKPVPMVEMKRVLNYWEGRHSIVHTIEIGNVFSKMKLLYNLSNSD